MIKKLKTIEQFDCSDTQQAHVAHHVYHNESIAKINELVDAVNEMQKNINRANCAILDLATPDAPNASLNSIKKQIDPYAEQKKWIGKLCRFWDFVYDNYYFDTLKGITDKGLFIGHNGAWEHCEPVKPDDDIIYKGGDNENA